MYKRQCLGNGSAQQHARHGIGDRHLAAPISQWKRDQHLGHLLDELSSVGNILLPLQVPSGWRYQQKAGAIVRFTGLRSRVLGAHRQLGTEQDHQQHGDESQRRQETLGDAEGTAPLRAPRQRITHHPTDCHRQARRRSPTAFIGGKNQSHAHASLINASAAQRPMIRCPPFPTTLRELIPPTMDFCVFSNESES